MSSNHLIKRHGTMMELLQAMEYERDRRFIGRRKGRFGCMTGMAAMYRVAALRDVQRAYAEVYVKWAGVAAEPFRGAAHICRGQDPREIAVGVYRCAALRARVEAG